MINIQHWEFLFDLIWQEKQIEVDNKGVYLKEIVFFLTVIAKSSGLLLC